MTLICVEKKVNSSSIRQEYCTQRISNDGRIQIGKKGWFFRILTLSAMVFLVIFNLFQGLLAGDPLVAYSTFMPLHTVLVFACGWLFYKSRANGKVENVLVSVIIPIYNQEALIEDVIDAIYRSSYRNIEVIAVNDGSKDRTKEILNDLTKKYPNLKVIHKKNEGKRRAVATGFYASRGKYIVLIDSDSIIDEHAIEEFVKAFSANPRIGGLVGNGKVWNAEKNILTRCQDVWYDYAFNIHKTTESVFGTVLCCSGCLAAYRREAIADFIPYWVKAKLQNSDDRDLTSYAIATPWAKREMAPLKQRLMESMADYDDSEDRGLTAQTLVEWETVYVPTAVVYTEVPEDLKSYLRQQTRWKKGYIRSNFYVSAFFWRKNPIMAFIFYIEFMATFTAPLIIFTIYFYSPFLMHNFSIPITYFMGQLLIGLAAGLDYKVRDTKAKYWMYKPMMNLVSSLILPWLIFPALWNYRRNQWLTR
ncbi:MAG: glycosyltransferase [Candidatus Bathyarchaeia archaeon]